MTTQSSAFEDNAGTIQVAKCPRLTLTSKFIAVKYYWFHSHIDTRNDGTKPMSIEKIDRKVNPADIFMKSKSKKDKFEALRKLLCGW